MKSTHAATMKAILELCQRPNIVLWRNNTGAAFPTGKDGRTRCVRYGLAKGSSDIIGMKDGRFVAIEVKDAKDRMPFAPKSVSGIKKLVHWQEQQAFIDLVNAQGGRAGFAWKLEDAFAILGMKGGA